MYPTKEEILAKKPKFRNGTIIVVKAWKAISMREWKDKDKEEKVIQENKKNEFRQVMLERFGKITEFDYWFKFFTDEEKEKQMSDLMNRINSIQKRF